MATHYELSAFGFRKIDGRGYQPKSRDERRRERKQERQNKKRGR